MPRLFEPSYQIQNSGERRHSETVVQFEVHTNLRLTVREIQTAHEGACQDKVGVPIFEARSDQ